MKKLLELKLSTGLLASAGFLALVLLVAELRGFVFRPADPFSFSVEGLNMPGGTGPGAVEIPFWKFILFAGLVILILAVILMLIDKQMRKELLTGLLRSFLAVAVLWMLMNATYQRTRERQAQEPGPAAGQSYPPGAQAPVAKFVSPQLSPWLVLGVSFGVGLALTLAGWRVLTRRSRPSSRLAMDEIAGIAREALEGLQPGADWDEAIVRAYVRMNEVVTEQRGFIRQPGSTPGEFAARMEREGLPGEAVRALTRLFEGVRYGGRNSTPQERDLAAAALSAIAHACGVQL
jgi:hypothetical protein